MTDALIIYALIGVSHWAAHVIQCSKCHEVLHKNVDFLSEGVVSALGWPIHFCTYMVSFFRRPTTGLTPEEVDQHVNARMRELMRDNDGGMVVELKQEPGEADEAFNERIKNTMGEIAAKAARLGRENREP